MKQKVNVHGYLFHGYLFHVKQNILHPSLSSFEKSALGSSLSSFVVRKRMLEVVSHETKNTLFEKLALGLWYGKRCCILCFT